MDQTSKTRLLAFILGFTSIIAQVLLLRELIVIFYGNETAYAMIFASWLFWISVGSAALSRIVSRIRNIGAWILLFFALSALALPGTIVAARFLRIFLNIPTGQIVGIASMAAAFLLLAPLTLLFGGLYSLLCRLGEDHNGSTQIKGISSIYLWESMGAAVGGFLFSFVLIRFLDSFVLAVMMSLTVLAVLILFSPWGNRSCRMGSAAAVIMGAVFFNGLIEQFDALTRREQWKGLKVIAAEDSLYGNLALIQLGKNFSLYENGLLSYTTGDEMSSEEQIHFPMLMHPDPRRVLLIGNGLGGGLKEALKYPKASIDYVEIDPMVIRLSEQYLDPDALKVLRDSRVRGIHTDGRWMVKRTRERYDVVIISVGDPATAMINRYYTAEFFGEAYHVLNPGGILSLNVSSSENYLGEEARDFLRTIHTTLKKVFPEVMSVPGDTNIFLAGERPGLIVLDAPALVRRLGERQISTKYVREYYLPYRLSPDRIDQINEILKKPGMLNTDARPVAYLYDIILWSTHFDTFFADVIKKFQILKPLHLLLAFPFFILLIGALLRKKIPSSIMTISIGVTGFSVMNFQLLVILAFQSLYGYAYYQIGFILASFMAGLVGGSLWARRMIRHGFRDIRKVYLGSQIALCLFPLVIPLLFIVFRDAAQAQKFWHVFAGAFAILPVAAGILGGLQYPLALEILETLRPNPKGSGASAGMLYGMDVLGATVGALISGTLLIPLFGINLLAYLCAAVNGAVLILLCLPTGKAGRQVLKNFRRA